MDIRMPELDGLEATRRIVGADPDARIRTHVLQKLGLRDRVQVVVLAYQAGLVES